MIITAGKETVITADKVLSGVRVLEVAAWTFVPSAGAVLAEWGAEVIKVEPLDGGDPQRGLVTMGIVDAGGGSVNYMIEIPNRGKKSIGVDLSTPGGQEVVRELAKTCDVFLTSYLPNRRKKFGIDVDDIRSVNPSIVYVRGSGHGPKGPDSDKPGYDGVSYWARGGIATVLTEAADELVRSRPAFGDLLGGMTIAGGIAAALYRKATTGEGTVVDVSLLGLAAWNLSPMSRSARSTAAVRFPSTAMPTHPIPWWGHIAQGRPLHPVDDAPARQVLSGGNARDRPTRTDRRSAVRRARIAVREPGGLIALLDEAFALRTLAEWRETLAGLSGAWGVVQTPGELCEDSGGDGERLCGPYHDDERCPVRDSPRTRFNSTN